MATKKEVRQKLEELVELLGGNLTPARKARLRDYAQALIEPVRTDMQDGLLNPAEAAFILSAAGLVVFLTGAKKHER